MVSGVEAAPAIMVNRDMQPRSGNRLHTDHDLAGWMDDGSSLDPTPAEAAVNVPSPTAPQPVAHRTSG